MRTPDDGLDLVDAPVAHAEADEDDRGRVVLVHHADPADRLAPVVDHVRVVVVGDARGGAPQPVAEVELLPVLRGPDVGRDGEPGGIVARERREVVLHEPDEFVARAQAGFAVGKVPRMPPSTAQPTPLTRLAASDARNATTAAISSACPSPPAARRPRPPGGRRRRPRSRRHLGEHRRVDHAREDRVHPHPGEATSDAAERVRPSTACLAALYAACPAARARSTATPC